MSDARKLTDGRKVVYGEPIGNMTRIAALWSVLFGTEINAWQVPLALAMMKIDRTSQTPDYSDNSDDVDGYMDLFRQVIGKDMVLAKTVDEYLEKKELRDAWKPEEKHGPCHAEMPGTTNLCTRMAGHVGPHDAARQDPSRGRGIVPPHIERKIEDHISKLNAQIVATVPEAITYSGGPDTQAPIDWGIKTPSLRFVEAEEGIDLRENE